MFQKIHPRGGPARDTVDYEEVKEGAPYPEAAASKPPPSHDVRRLKSLPGDPGPSSEAEAALVVGRLKG